MRGASCCSRVCHFHRCITTPAVHDILTCHMHMPHAHTRATPLSQDAVSSHANSSQRSRQNPPTDHGDDSPASRNAGASHADGSSQLSRGSKGDDAQHSELTSSDARPEKQGSGGGSRSLLPHHEVVSAPAGADRQSFGASATVGQVAAVHAAPAIPSAPAAPGAPPALMGGTASLARAPPRPLPGVTQVSAATHTDVGTVEDLSAPHASQGLTLLCLEAFVSTSGSMTPNAGRLATAERIADPGDQVVFVWLAVQEDMPPSVADSSQSGGCSTHGSSVNGQAVGSQSGSSADRVGPNSGSGRNGAASADRSGSSLRHIVVMRTDGESMASGERAARRYCGLLGSEWPIDEMRLVQSEAELLVTVAAIVREVDADILLAWDARQASVGFLIERANVIGIDPPLIRQLGRTPEHRNGNEDREDTWGALVSTGIHIIGRIIINLWRCARAELQLTSFTIQNVAAKVLQERVPVYSHRTLTEWWHGSTRAPGVTVSSTAADMMPPPPPMRPAMLPPLPPLMPTPPPHDTLRRDDGRVRVLRHFAQRVSLGLRIAEAMELIPRTSELARVFGIDFQSVITRGSQYRVESMLLRLCRTQGYAVASPDKMQVKTQPSLMCLPLIMEPEGRFYTSPVVVLDFRSLYPSVIIAYNYCYSTCLGPLATLERLLNGGTAANGGERGDGSHVAHRFGCLELSARGFCTSAEAAAHHTPAAQLHACLRRLTGDRAIGTELPRAVATASVATTTDPGFSAAACEQDVTDAAENGSCNGTAAGHRASGLHASPNGVLFTTAATRPGVLPRLLKEILETRFMVKRAMKQVPAGSALHRTLNARQFGLKLIANVTYGYTSASFSGRMPNVHLADAIVQTGRETLMRTIELVNSHPKWGARVVYGDTDSLFVLLEGRTRQEAFAVGREIAETVTAANPHPMELEMEKVYHPCVLCTKKRYVGYMYEHERATPRLDAKGVEIIRRDTCAAERKVLEKCLRLLFTTSDLSAVKSYVLRQCDKLQMGRVALIDYVIASEVRLGTYKSDETAPPGAQVARHRQQIDPNDKVQTGERVPYVVINRQESARLRDSAQRPEAILFPPRAVDGSALHQVGLMFHGQVRPFSELLALQLAAPQP